MKNLTKLVFLLLFIAGSVSAKNLQVEWAKQIFSDQSVIVDDIQTDQNENVYVCGEFKKNIYFGDGTTFTSKGTDGFFLAKYDPSGELLWAKHIAITLTGHCQSICFDEFHMVYVCGNFFGTASFDNSTYTSVKNVCSGFISKYTPEGIEQWVHLVGSSQNTAFFYLHCDQNGGIYSTGEYCATTNFGNGHSLNLNEWHETELYIAKYNYNGQCQMVKAATGPGPERGLKIESDKNGNIYTTGKSSGIVDFGNNIKTSYVGPYNNRDAYIAKYNSSGICQWAISIMGPMTQASGYLSVDDSGNIFFEGTSEDDLDLGNGIKLLVPAGETVFTFISKFDTYGICQWAKIIKNVGIAEVKYFQNELYFCGAYTDSLDLENGKSLTNSGYKDAVVFNADTDGNLKWGKNLSNIETDAVIGDISIFDPNSIYVSGTFLEDFLIDGKFDFILTGEKDAFIAKLTPGIMIHGDSVICDPDEAILTASDGFDSYEWSTGETTQSIVVTESGEYTVSATDDDNNVYHSQPFGVRIIKTLVEGLNNVSLRVENLSDTDQETLKFENKGSDPISVLSVELKDSDPNFEVSTSVTLPIVLPVGGYFDITISYAPEIKGLVADSLIVIIDDPCPVRFSNHVEGLASVCDELSFIYPDFSSLDKLNMPGSSSTDSSVILTWAKQKKSGAIWRDHRVPVKNGFITEFRFRLSDGDNFDNEDGSLPGADGIAFVVQNSDPNALGGNGGRIGYAGLENAIAIELDLFSNDENQIVDYLDPDGNHIAVLSNGSEEISCIHTPENDLGMTSDIPEVKSDGTVYTMRIEYTLNPDVMKIYLSENDDIGTPVLTVTDLKLSELISLHKGEGAYVGITAATGSAAQIHEILDWEFCAENSNYPDTSSCHPLSFSYTEYTSADKLNFVGTCRNGNNSVILNNSSKYATGVLWRNQRVPVKNGFYTKYRFRVTNGNNSGQKEYSEPGADGIVFVLQNSNPLAIGSVGSQIGYGGIENALAVELDLFTNDINQVDNFLDPDGNHIAVQSSGYGPIKCIHDSKNNFGIASDIPIVKSDGTIYTMLIEYNLEPDVMNVYLSETDDLGSPLLTVTDLRISDLLDLHKGEGAYVGFTSSTGEAIQSHEILEWEFCASHSDYVSVDDKMFLSDESTVIISPNPCDNYVTLILPELKTDCRVNIYDLLGNKLFADDIIIPVGQSAVQLDIRGFAAGAYLLRVNMGSEIVVENLMIK